MKVRVKKDKSGFIYGSLRKEGAEFTLKSFEHPRKLDDDGDPLVVSIESQFSKVWMEEVEPKKEVETEAVFNKEPDEDLDATPPKAAKKKAAKKTKE